MASKKAFLITWVGFVFHHLQLASRCRVRGLGSCACQLAKLLTKSETSPPLLFLASLPGRPHPFPPAADCSPLTWTEKSKRSDWGDRTRRASVKSKHSSQLHFESDCELVRELRNLYCKRPRSNRNNILYLRYLSSVAPDVCTFFSDLQSHVKKVVVTLRQNKLFQCFFVT